MTDPVVNVTTGKSQASAQLPVPANIGGICPPSEHMMDPAAYAVNVPNVMECISQPLYSYQSYPAAGSANPLLFFQTQAVGAVTLEDTNMQLAGQLPSPQKFLIEGIAVDFISGNAVSKFGAETANGNLNDFYAVMKRGLISLNIGTKNYLRMTTALQLPPRAHINGGAAVADATTAAASLQTLIQFGFSDGNVFTPRPLLLEASQNFDVAISYPGGAVAIPSGDTAARIGVWLYGKLYRSAQ